MSLERVVGDYSMLPRVGICNCTDDELVSRQEAIYYWYLTAPYEDLAVHFGVEQDDMTETWKHPIGFPLAFDRTVNP